MLGNETQIPPRGKISSLEEDFSRILSSISGTDSPAGNSASYLRWSSFLEKESEIRFHC